MAQTHAGNLPTITADFNGTPVTIIERDGQRWLTAEQIGLALGYNQANARIGISNLYGRHTDEFGDQDTRVIKLMTGSRGEQNARIFSATGCIKLGFFASTPKAKEFRTWASEVLAEQAGHAVPAPVPAPQDQATELLGRHVVELTRQVTLLMRQVGSLSRKVISTQSKLVKAQERTIALVEGHMSGEEATATIIRMEREGKSRAAIVAATGRNHNAVRQAIFKARERGELPAQTTKAAQAQQTTLDLQGA